jgi:hypothetical protein
MKKLIAVEKIEESKQYLDGSSAQET